MEDRTVSAAWDVVDPLDPTACAVHHLVHFPHVVDPERVDDRVEREGPVEVGGGASVFGIEDEPPRSTDLHSGAVAPGRGEREQRRRRESYACA